MTSWILYAYHYCYQFTVWPHRQKYLWWEKTGISLLDLYLRQSRAQASAQAQAKQHLNRERYEKPQGCVRIQPLLFTRKIFVAWIAEGGRYFMGENSKNFLRWRSQIYRELRSHQKESKQYYSCKNRTRHRPVVGVIVGLFLSKCLMCVVVWTVKWWNTFQRSPWKKCVQ